jgi:hypothetical protein
MKYFIYLCRRNGFADKLLNSKHMRKFYVLLLMAFGAAGMCMAQDTAGGDTVEGDSTNVIAVEKVTINNWDGSYKSPNMPLYIGVEEIKILSLTLDPENADIETLHIIIEAEEWNEGEETGKEEGYDDVDYDGSPADLLQLFVPQLWTAQWRDTVQLLRAGGR